MVSGIMRNEKSFDGVVYKGVGKDFDRERFEKFMISGSIPKYDENGYNNEVIVSGKIATDLGLKVKDSIVAIFSKEDQKPVYRKFEVAGIYKTDIKLIDDLFVIGDINQVRKIQGMEKSDIGGLDIYLKDIDDIDKEYPEIEELIGYKNYAEKATEIYYAYSSCDQYYHGVANPYNRKNKFHRCIENIGRNQFPDSFAGNLIGLGLLFIQKYFGIIKLNPDNYFISVVPVDLNILYILGISVGILLIAALAMIVPSYLIRFISGITGAVGLLFNRFYLRFGMSNQQIVATRAANEVVLHIVKLIMYIYFGLFTLMVLKVGLVVAAAAVLSSYVMKKSFTKDQYEMVFNQIGFSSQWSYQEFYAEGFFNKAQKDENASLYTTWERKGFRSHLTWSEDNYTIEFKWSEVKLNRVLGEDFPALVLAKVETFNPGNSVKDRMDWKMDKKCGKGRKTKAWRKHFEGTSGKYRNGTALLQLSRIQMYFCDE
ncbi:hypothetical protein FQR65_LT17990 [Abscondita terminalis]|nr:hypothetical protein FQR65_LT17990 [Abscondita terminalis]